MKMGKLLFSLLFVAVMFHSCAKEYSSEHYLGARGSWEFANSNLNYSGSVKDIHQNTGLGTQSIFINGISANGSEIFQLSISADTLKPGSYSSSLFQCVFSYTNSSKTLYKANSKNGEFTVTILSIDDLKVTGTFSGFAIDESGNTIEITNGKFMVE
jgi:hypothetical protein